jgi:hypothetical protein
MLCDEQRRGLIEALENADADEEWSNREQGFTWIDRQPNNTPVNADKLPYPENIIQGHKQGATLRELSEKYDMTVEEVYKIVG